MRSPVVNLIQKCDRPISNLLKSAIACIDFTFKAIACINFRFQAIAHSQLCGNNTVDASYTKLGYQ
jgi:hypothetical protein